MNYVRLLGLMLVSFLALTSLALAAPTITVTNPNGGECLVVGNAYVVSWSSAQVNHFAFYYVKNTSGLNGVPAYGSWMVHPISSSSWSWTPNSNDITDNDGSIWIEGHDASHKRLAIDGTNDTFAVRTECSAPTIINVSATSLSQTGATIIWTTNESADSQVEYGKTTSYGTKTSVQQTSGVTSHSLTLANLQKATTYHYRVISKDPAGNTSKLGDFTFTTQGSNDTTKPGSITTLTVQAVSGNSITLEWKATGDDGANGQATSYDLRYSTSPITNANWTGATKANGEPVPAQAGVSQTMTVSSLVAETKYYFAIRALDEAGNMSDLDTTQVTAITGPDIYPPLITNVLLSNVTQTSIKVSWDTDEAATYRLDYGINSNYGQNVSSNNFSTSQSVTLNNLIANTTYHYRIIATDAKNNTTTGEDRLFQTPGPLTLEFITDKVMVSKGQEITLVWRASLADATCNASGGWSGSKSYSGNQKITVNATTTYVLTCDNSSSSPVTKSVTVSVTTANISGLQDGDLIRVSSLPGEDGRNVWIVKISADRTRLYRRLILNPSIFANYGHLAHAVIKEAGQDVRDVFKVSNYVRAYDPARGVDDPKVYLLTPNLAGDDGIKQHMNVTAQEFYANVDPFALFIINTFERDSYTTGIPLTTVAAF